MSGTLPELQQQAEARADDFCRRYTTPARRRRNKVRRGRACDGPLKRQAQRAELVYDDTLSLQAILPRSDAVFSNVW